MASCSAPATAAAPYFPPDLIPKVASRLTSLQDFFALGASCRAYRAALPLTPSNLASQAPLLLIVPHQDRPTESPTLFYINLRRRLRLRLRLRFRFRLPRTRQASSTPYWRHHPRRHLRQPEGSQPVASIRGGYLLDGMICVKGTIYALVSTGYQFDNPIYLLAAVKLSDNSSSVELEFLGEALGARTLHLPVGTELCLKLAECHGELIPVVTMEFNPDVYHCLGGCALFFATPYFVGCLGPDHPGIRKDCIYLNGEGLWSEYSSVDGSFRRSDVVYPEGELLEGFRSSCWVFPSMC
ncbi:hypothetical protein GQ55_6G280500 [Panicum hallii var. hallii]|uniref:DUF295 domain-containing protein n=1 Tax=Panicum hallii var. hallii TaxID=1504633 RepID=A0A2T7DAC9_9POAL|nr:hypothetical protein GQ55_6G280500 [Panicum hallii var. hallii]